MTKLTVRWRAMTGAQPHYPELHVPDAYTVWMVNGHKIVIHDPKRACLHKTSNDTDRHVLLVLKGARELASLDYYEKTDTKTDL